MSCPLFGVLDYKVRKYQYGNHANSTLWLRWKFEKTSLRCLLVEIWTYIVHWGISGESGNLSGMCPLISWLGNITSRIGSHFRGHRHFQVLVHSPTDPSQLSLPLIWSTRYQIWSVRPNFLQFSTQSPNCTLIPIFTISDGFDDAVNVLRFERSNIFRSESILEVA